MEPDKKAVVDELRHLYGLICSLNIPVVADDVDAGYDMAVDEVLDLISGRIDFYENPNQTQD